MSNWLDRIAYEVEAATIQVRDQLRGIPAWERIVIPVSTARALLHGCMPTPLATSSRRAQHARTVAALSLCARQMVALNDPAHQTDAPIAAAIDLIAELQEWVRRARWAQATTAARVSWPAPPQPVRAVMRLSTPEQMASAPDPVAGRAAHPATPLHQVRQLAARSRAAATQLELALAPPPEAPDPRQNVLAFPPLADRRQAA